MDKDAQPGDKLKILYALDSYRPNIDGVGISTERQASRLAARGHDVMLVAPAQRFADYAETAAGLDVFRVRTIRFISNRWRMAVLTGGTVERIIDTFRPDVVVINLPFPLNSAILREARKRHVPIVGVTGTMPEWILAHLPFLKPLSGVLYPTIWRYLAAYYNRCDVVIGVTPTALRFLEAYGLKKPATVISNGVELRSFYPRPKDRRLAERLHIPDKSAVLYAGRLDAEKRVDILIHAIPLVLQEVDCHFVIGGDGSERVKLQEMSARLGVDRNVTFTGFLDTSDYQSVYSLADVFAIASPAELQSIVTLEAAASGLPIVAVNAGALPELVKDGRNGLLFPPDNPAELAAVLVRLLQNEELRRSMGQESRAIARRHDIDLAVSRYEVIYRGVIAGKVPQPRFREKPERVA
ncbi:MAG: glycosyltransferase [Chloroflexi bacterium]|nr:glycosyltransferase [Chloroflexota bacterium]